jgi:TATA-box binding protein (TBP) (component of TFIID and TFIIIB)
MTELEFPDFESNPVSTRTYIAVTNLNINIEELYAKLPITPYVAVTKKRGRKKKIEATNPNTEIVSGSIITLEHGESVRGVDLKKKKEKAEKKRQELIAAGEVIPKKTSNYFRNSLTIVMVLSIKDEDMNEKKINFKAMRSGKFQLTGCKHEKQAIQCIRFIWNYIKDDKTLYTMKEKNEKNIRVVFVPAMRNIDFNIGFLVDRQKLDTYINTCTEYISMLQMSVGYTGVNIKMPLKMALDDIVLTKLTYRTNKKGKGNWWLGKITYAEYFKLLDEKDQKKDQKKKRRNTFLAFHSGMVIMSGLVTDTMREPYHEFLQIIRDCHDTVKETLTKDTEEIDDVDIDEIKEMQIALFDSGWTVQAKSTNAQALRYYCIELLGEHY